MYKRQVYDIDAGIDFLVKQGYEEIVLIGHSTGANKVSFYSGRKNDPRILGVILISPISDRLVPQKVSTNHNGDLLSMNRFIDQGKGDELMPGKIFFPLTPKRFVSLYSRGSEEDTFDYGDPQPKMNYFSKITKPLLVIFAEKDESSDRPMYQIKNIFDACSTSRHYESTIVKNAFHSFGERENLLIELIMTWVLKL